MAMMDVDSIRMSS